MQRRLATCYRLLHRWQSWRHGRQLSRLAMALMRKSLKTKRTLERALQYRVIAERLQFHLDRESLPDEAAELVRTAQQALARAADVVENSAREPVARTWDAGF